MNLFPYQTEGAAFLASRRRAMLLDEQGLGKTAQAIEACNLVDADPVLVICPASLRTNWLREFQKFGQGQRVVSESYDRVARDPAKYDGPWGAVILDEAHYLKSPNAKRTRSVYGDKELPGLLMLSGHTWALTGTPAPNNAVEMYTHMAALFPESLAMVRDKTRRYDRFRFTQRYCVTAPGEWGEKIVGGKNHEDLKARLAPHVLRRVKKEVLPDLPAITYSELPIDAPSVARSLKDVPGEEMAMLRDALKDGDAAALEGMATEMASLRRLIAVAKIPLMVEWAKDFLEQTDRKLVIFGHHVEPLEELRQQLRDRTGGKSQTPVVVTGSSRPANRQKSVDKFQEDPDTRVFLGQIQAAGTGITLTAASDLVFLEQSWVPAENAQAAMRIHRIGQTRGCMVRYMSLAGSIDEAVQRVLARKTADISKLFD